MNIRLDLKILIYDRIFGFQKIEPNDVRVKLFNNPAQGVPTNNYNINSVSTNKN